jgi:hypothetical protein
LKISQLQVLTFLLVNPSSGLVRDYSMTKSFSSAKNWVGLVTGNRSVSPFQLIEVPGNCQGSITSNLLSNIQKAEKPHSV